MRLGQAAAEDREVLRKQVDGPAVDRARTAGHDPVAEDRVLVRVHAEVAAAVRHEPVHLDEAAGIDEQVDALPRGQLAALVLGGDALLATALQRTFAQLFEHLLVISHG